MKRFLAILFAVMMVLTLFVSCKKEGSSSKEGKVTEIAGYFASSPETIDPNINSSMDGSTYIVHLFQGLYRYKWDGTGVEKGDAASVAVSDDQLTWTFTLRDDAKWSDGQKVTAADYEYAWKRVFDPAVAAPYGYDMAAFILNATEALDGDKTADEIGVKALNENTLEVKLAGPCPFFDQIASFPVLYPVRQDKVTLGDDWWTKPENYISNGAYKMQSFTLDQDLVVVPNENYYEASNVVATKITFKFYADESVALNALRAGEIDIANQSPAEETEALTRDGMFGLRDQLGTYYISFNNEKAPFNNPLVRKAFSLAADREYLAETVMLGTRIPANAMVCPGYQDVDTAKDFNTVAGGYISGDYEANKAAAKAALAEAGYPDGKGFPKVTYIYNESTGHAAVAEALQKDWETVLGVKVDLSVQEWNTFLETRRKGNFDISRNGWVSDWMDPSSMLTIFQTGGGNNDGKYSNPLFDQYMAESYATSDHAARIAAMHNAEKVLMDDFGCAPLMFYKQSYMFNTDIKDWYDVSLGYTLLFYAYK